jgi:Ca2+-binding EF-hand superfamily protein
MQILKNDNKLKDIMGLIQQIDKDRNGYVTSTELDDILKILYPT